MRSHLALLLGLTLASRAAGAAPTQRGLSLSISVPATSPSADHVHVTVTIENVSKRPISLFTHVATHETQYDWLRFRLGVWAASSDVDAPRLPGWKPCSAHWPAAWQWTDINLTDARDRSARITRVLQPGEKLTQDIDLSDWAKRMINGTRALTAGDFRLEAIYSNKERGQWVGTLRSAQAAFHIDGIRPPLGCPLPK